jgi:hypothetical protein
MTHVLDLKIGDTLYRFKPQQECCIKDITSNRNGQRVFEFFGFLVDQEVMPRMFKNSRGVFHVKD